MIYIKQTMHRYNNVILRWFQKSYLNAGKTTWLPTKKLDFKRDKVQMHFISVEYHWTSKFLFSLSSSSSGTGMSYASSEYLLLSQFWSKILSVKNLIPRYHIGAVTWEHVPTTRGPTLYRQFQRTTFTGLYWIYTLT